MARGIEGHYGTDTGGSPARQVGPPPPDNGTTGPPNPITSPDYTLGMPSGMPSPAGAVLLPLQNPNASDSAEQHAFEGLRDLGVSGVLSTQLVHEQPAYKWRNQEMAALPDYHRNTGVGSAGAIDTGSGSGSGSSGAWDPAPGPNYNYHMDDLMLMTDPPMTDS